MKFYSYNYDVQKQKGQRMTIEQMFRDLHKMSERNSKTKGQAAKTRKTKKSK